ncbi:hypothetical protein N8071_00435 [bacterium]|nr:hypothetical protein [bacterium]
MLYSDWLDQTRTAEDKHLIYYNFSNLDGGRLDGGLDLPAFRDARDRFVNFLGADVSVDPPEKLLKRFCEDEITNLGAAAAAYAGIKIPDEERFCAVKSIRSFENNPAAIGLPTLNVRELGKAYHRAAAKVDVTTFSDRGDQMFTSNFKREVKRQIDIRLDQARRREAHARVRAGRHRSAGGIAVSGAAYHNKFPLWLTKKSALDAMTRSLPADATVEERSGHYAGLRCELGLFHPSDENSDREFSIGPREARNFFDLQPNRIAVQLTINIPAAAAVRPTQPTVFSMGFDHLFVARGAVTSTGASSEPMAGKTVKLADKSCSTHGATCECGMPGLPEAVIPTEEIFTVATGLTVDIESIDPIFSEDLRYEPPECDMIRMKNPV